MKIRASDGTAFHINEHHVIHLYRAVNRDRIGTSTGTHVVLMSEFTDWNGLAEKANESGSVFTHNKITWKKSGSEIFPNKAADMVELHKHEIQALASYLNDDVEIAIAKRDRSQDFTYALTVIEQLKKVVPGTVLAFPWPRRFASGVTHKPGSTGPLHTEHFVWGPGGGADFPHIHCFVKPDGTLYEALATLKPLHGLNDKRHFKFLSDFTVPREGTLNDDDAVLTVLEKVLKAVVYGEDLATPAPEKKRRGKEKQASSASSSEDAVEVVVIDQRYVTFAEKHEVEAAWVAQVATEFSITPDEIAGWTLEGLVELTNIEV